MKPAIKFRAATAEDIERFCALVSYFPGSQFRGIVAYSLKVTDDGVDDTGFSTLHIEEVLMGMVGFDGWTPRTVITHWMIRHPRCIAPLWAEAIRYIEGSGRKAMIGVTPSNNERALKAIQHLGWKRLYVIKDAYEEGVDFVISEYPIHGTANTGTGLVRPDGHTAAAGAE